MVCYYSPSVFTFATLRTCCRRTSRTCPKILTCPIPRSQFIVCCVAFVPSSKRRPCRGAIVVPIALSPKMKKLFLAIRTGEYHLLLAGAIGCHDTVTLHFRFVSHYLPNFLATDLAAPFMMPLTADFLAAGLANFMAPLLAGAVRILAFGNPDPPFVDAFFICYFIFLVWVCLRLTVL